MVSTKSQIVKQVHDIGFTQKEAAKIVENLLEIIKKSLPYKNDIG